MARPKLHSIGIRNFLGAGDEGVEVEFAGEYGVLCGPNNSGKTTVLHALSFFSNVPSFQYNPNFQIAGQLAHGVAIQPVGVSQSADAFHRDAHSLAVAQNCSAKITFQVPMSFQNLGDVLRTIMGEPLPGAASIGFEVSLQRQQPVLSLIGLWLDDKVIFLAGKDTEFFARVPLPWYATLRHGLEQIFELPKALMGRIMLIPSLRGLTSADHFNLQDLATNQGVIGWVRSAKNPSPDDPTQRRRYELLQQFEAEFADFANFKSVSLSVPLNRAEINVTVNGHLRPLTRLGSGIGECLLILLVCKLAAEREVPIDIVLLEEPELHLHPALQRKLLDRLSTYDVQLILTTHSPTVINWVGTTGGRVFRTEFDYDRERIGARRVSRLTELRALLDGIGLSPADALLADKILWVEGPNDVPVFRAWVRKAPTYRNQRITILPLQGTVPHSPNFDAGGLSSLHPRMCAILDSERKAENLDAESWKLGIKQKLEAVGIKCHLTERRATESYLTATALQNIYPGSPAIIDPYGDPNLVNQGVKQFSKSRNYEVAQAMQWADIAKTDIGETIEEFLTTLG